MIRSFIYSLFLTLVFWSFSISTYGTNGFVEFSIVAVDSTDMRGFDQRAMDELNELDRYDYDQVIERRPNPILRFFLNVITFFAKLFGSTIGYIILAALIIGLVWIIVTNVKAPKKRIRVSPEEVLQYNPDQDIQAIDYTGLLEDAIRKENFRLAIRYMYIIALQKLQNAGLIQWHKEKTNRDYYYELPNDLQIDFSEMLRIYEYVWYGEFSASRDLMEQVKSYSSTLQNKTNSEQ